MVSPLSVHSLTSGGASIEVTFALATKGSLMMFTVNSFVARMLFVVSFTRGGPFMSEIEMTGGATET